MYQLKQIAEITNSTYVGNNNYKVNQYLTDSRNLRNAENVLFIAINTQRNNGHNYINQLIEKGVTSFLINGGEYDASNAPSHISFIVCNNTLTALQSLASYHRKQFTIPVIGITGSNGKTVVKEWLYQLLKSKYTICRSPKSYNSQLGVPLSVLNLNELHNLAIFEAGISKPQEMPQLAKIIQPTIGIFTSIGDAHSESFSTIEHKIEEKALLMRETALAFVNGVSRQSTHFKNNKTVFINTENADVTYTFKNNLLHYNSVAVNHGFTIPFKDEASVKNCVTCITILLHFNYTTNEIQHGLNLLQPIALRLEVKNGVNNSIIINDFYNSDSDSLKIALDFLQQQHRRNKKVVVVSDIEQSGLLPNQLYKKLADLFHSSQIDLVVGIGNEIEKFKFLFKANSLFFKDTANFLQQFKLINYLFSDSTILLKGARSYGFEAISALLQQKSHDTVFEVNLTKLTNNINYFRGNISNTTKIMAMVKATGYGSGSIEIAKTLQHAGINYLAVAYADEGVELRQANINLPIMVMNPETDALEDIITYNLEPEIYSFKLLNEFVSKLDQMGVVNSFPIHLKIDTGMRRLGFEPSEVDELINKLKSCSTIKVVSIFSHLAASDNSDLDEFTNHQISVFKTCTSKIETALGYSTIKHICNSGAITRFKQAHFDMVRLGIGMYGVGVNNYEQKLLENVGTLRTKISQIKIVEAGETVGYNRNGKTDKRTKIATIPIGYADGFSRLLGNGRHGVYIDGSFIKTIGNICMDMCMIDVTEINCNEGDEVIIFQTIQQINDLSAAISSIPYEVLTSVSSRVKRVYVQE